GGERLRRLGPPTREPRRCSSAAPWTLVDGRPPDAAADDVIAARLHGGRGLAPGVDLRFRARAALVSEWSAYAVCRPPACRSRFHRGRSDADPVVALPRRARAAKRVSRVAQRVDGGCDRHGAKSG